MKLRERIGRMLLGTNAEGSVAPAAAPQPAARPVVSRTYEDRVKELLEVCAKTFVPRGLHVRANVMTFSPDGSKRQVNASTAFNMENDPDRNLEVDALAAASGRAVSERRATVADLVLLQITAEPTWGMTQAEQSRVRPTLKSILSVPVFNPRDVDGPLIGTLQVDSDLTVEEAGFNKPEAAELLQQFADLLALLMMGVDVRIASVPNEFSGVAAKSRVQNATQVEPGLYVANSSTSIFQLSKR